MLECPRGQYVIPTRPKSLKSLTAIAAGSSNGLGYALMGSFMKHRIDEMNCLLDLSGLHCPVPLIRCLAALHRLPHGARLQVTLSTRDALNDIALLLRRSTHQLVDWQQDANGHCHFQIHKNAPSSACPSRTVSWLDLLLHRAVETSTLVSVG